MLVNFQDIMDLAMIVYDLGQPVIVDGFLVDEYNFPFFISQYYDA